MTLQGSTSTSITPAIPRGFIVSQPFAIETSRAIAEARRLQQEERAPATLFSYENCWKSFTRWVSKHHPDEDALPAAPGLIGVYIGSLRVNKLHKRTVLGRLYAIQYAHELAGIPSPLDDPQVKRIMRGLQRQPDATRRERRAITRELAIEILSHLPPPETILDLRDRVVFSLSWCSAMRRSEIAAIDIEHLSFGTDPLTKSEYLRIYIPRSKTDQNGAGDFVDIPRLPTDSPLCAVRAVLRWFEVSGLLCGPLFPAMNWMGQAMRASSTGAPERLTGPALYKRMKRLLTAAGYDARLWAPHSLRRGFATSADAAGVRPSLIQRHGRWKSLAMVSHYTIHEGLRENALRDMFT